MGNEQVLKFDKQETKIYFESDFEQLSLLANPESSVIITDEHIFPFYQNHLQDWKCITIPQGEQSKSWEIIQQIIYQLLEMEADRSMTIIGFGGGVVTDIAGFVAGIYKRGLRLGLVPTSILGMMDAAIGGKNGINSGNYKNVIGLIRQPDFIAYLPDVLKTLAQKEWINGFAEIIKHACIADRELFDLLKQNDLSAFQNNTELINNLIKTNVLIKSNIVLQDEQEMNRRKMLNFGHTFGHAVEQRYKLPHGHAVSIGMVMAAKLSEKEIGFSETEELIQMLHQYLLPISISYDKEEIMENLIQDKKRKFQDIDYVLLKEIGKAEIQTISIKAIKDFLNSID